MNKTVTDKIFNEGYKVFGSGYDNVDNLSMKCKYRVIGREIGIYYFYDLQSAVNFVTDDGGILQYFNNNEWKDVE